jgi:hypothetical protein
MAPSRVDPNKKQAKSSIDQVEEDPFCIDKMVRTISFPSQPTVSIYLPSSPPIIMETLTDKAKSTSPFTSASIPPPLVRMVQAKTEDGNWRTVPLYKAGMDVCYRNDNDIQECKILTVHHDNPLELYYTLRLLDGKMKQTDNTHIMLRLQDGKKCAE